MTISEKVAVLKKNAVFDKLPPSEYEILASKAKPVNYKKGEVIFKENMSADAFYVIVSGEVEILKEGEDGMLETLALRKEHESFGEMSMIDDLPRSATIRARKDLSLLMIIKEDFVELMRTLSSLSYSIAKSVCSTVRSTNDTYIRDLENRNKELELAYEELKKTQVELIRAEKLSVIGKFASLIIHDIKNPLTNIRAYAELIGINNKSEDKITKGTSIIIREVDRLSDMTSELLEFARGNIKLSRIPININSYLATVIDTFSPDLFNRNVKIVLNKCNKDLLVDIDSDKMNRVFFNLIGNACDAIEGEGVITISINQLEEEILISIKDNGCGMNRDVMEKIFEPFYTRKSKGTGLGMAIVKSIITGHGGRIGVRSKPSVGTVFDVFIPLG